MTFHRVVVAFALLALSQPSYGQFETVVLVAVHAVRLGGAIVDPAGGAVNNALVEQVDCPVDLSHWISEPHILQKTRTDANGRFSMQPAEKKNSYCLRVSSPGFDNLNVQILIRRFSRDLRLTLPIAA